MWQHFPSDQRINLQAVFPAMDLDLGRAGRDEGFIAYSVVGEAIVGPLTGRGEIEFPVGRLVDRCNEGLAAGVLPELIFGGRWLFPGEQDVVGVAD